MALRPTVRAATRQLVTRMRPHLGHQRRWRRLEDSTIDCQECHRKIIGPDDLQRAGIAYLTPAERDAVRESVARWIRANSDAEARIIIPMHRPD